MPKLLIDEDMPRSTARMLREHEFDAMDVRDCGLRGKSDEQTFKFAQSNDAVVLTGDLGFGNLLDFPLGSHHGIVIVHFPNQVSTSASNRQILLLLSNLDDDDLDGNLVVFEPGKIRIRRK